MLHDDGPGREVALQIKMRFIQSDISPGCYWRVVSVHAPIKVSFLPVIVKKCEVVLLNVFCILCFSIFPLYIVKKIVHNVLLVART